MWVNADFVSRVIRLDQFGFTREVQICVDPIVMPKIAKVRDQSKSFLRTDMSKPLLRARITYGTLQIFTFGEIVNCNHPNTFWEFYGYLFQPNWRACNQGSFKGICFTLFQIKNISPKYGKLEKNEFEEISIYICEESKIPKGNHYWLVLLWGRTHTVLPIQDKGCWISFDIWYTYVRGGFWKKHVL